MTKEVEEYFFERYEKCGFRVVPGHWPDFKSKEEVDKWFDTSLFAKMVETMRERGREKLKSIPYTCPTCKNTEHSEGAIFCKICGRRNDDEKFNALLWKISPAMPNA